MTLALNKTPTVREDSFVYTGKTTTVLGTNGLRYTARVVRPQTWAEGADLRARQFGERTGELELPAVADLAPHQWAGKAQPSKRKH